MTADQQFYDDITGHGKPETGSVGVEPEEVPLNTPPQDTHEPQVPVVIEECCGAAGLEAGNTIPVTDEHFAQHRTTGGFSYQSCR